MIGAAGHRSCWSAGCRGRQDAEAAGQQDAGVTWLAYAVVVGPTGAGAAGLADAGVVGPLGIFIGFRFTSQAFEPNLKYSPTMVSLGNSRRILQKVQEKSLIFFCLKKEKF